MHTTIHVSDFGREIEIHDLQWSHAGKYQCVGTNPQTQESEIRGIELRVECKSHTYDEQGGKQLLYHMQTAKVHGPVVQN